MNAAQLKRIIAANPDLKDVCERQNEDSLLQFAAVDIIKQRAALRSSVVQMKEVIGKGLKKAEDRLEEELDNESAKMAELRRSVAH